MKLYLKLVLAAGLYFTWFSCYSQLLIKPSNKNIAYMGRIGLFPDSSCIYWPGSSVNINFKGTGISAVLRSFKDKDYFYVIVDHDDTNPLKIVSDSVKKQIVLASNLSPGTHSIQIYKLSNCVAETRVYGFEIIGKAKVLPASVKHLHKIEFFGNSITAGHSVDAPPQVKNAGSAQYFNNYYTYASLTARHFNAQYSFIARSGIGITVSWFPEIMPEIYDRLNPADPASRWDFSKFTPDIVVVNLLQNDYWLTKMPDHEQFKARFGTSAPNEEFMIGAYQNFIASLRLKYPKAAIICALGSMNATEPGSKYPGYIRQAVKNLDDKQIQTLFFSYKNTPGHPSRKEQKAMSDQLISFIEKNMGW